MSLRVVGERAPDRLSRIADHIAATAEASAVGIRVCRIARDTMVAALEAAVSTRVRALGFVFVRATKPPPRSRASPVLSRHVVIWCGPNKASRRTAIEWVRALSTEALAAIARPRGARAADRRRGAPRRRDHGFRAGFDRRRTGRRRTARPATPSGAPRSWPAPLLTVALRGQSLPRPRTARQTRSGGERTMRVVTGVPALLQLVQEADDELAALTGACAWVRRQTGADRVGMVEADGAALVATDGWSRGDLPGRRRGGTRRARGLDACDRRPRDGGGAGPVSARPHRPRAGARALGGQRRARRSRHDGGGADGPGAQEPARCAGDGAKRSSLERRRLSAGARRSPRCAKRLGAPR